MSDPAVAHGSSGHKPLGYMVPLLLLPEQQRSPIHDTPCAAGADPAEIDRLRNPKPAAEEIAIGVLGKASPVWKSVGLAQPLPEEG